MTTGAWLGVALACSAVALVVGLALGFTVGRNSPRTHAGDHDYDDVDSLARIQARIHAREAKGKSP